MYQSNGCLQNEDRRPESLLILELLKPQGRKHTEMLCLTPKEKKFGRVFVL